MSYRNSDGKSFELKEDRIYNLGTGRYLVLNAPNKKKFHLYQIGNSYIGSEDNEVLQDFLRSNNLNTGAEAVNVKENSVQVPLPIVKSEDPEDIPANALADLNLFSLNGYKGKSLVSRVLDGDTIEVVFFIRFSTLINSKSILITDTGNNQGFFVKQRCRFLGMDASEINTAQGVEAKRLLILRLEESKNVADITVHGYDKYGRILIDLRIGGVDFIQYIVNYTHPILGKLALPYNGGT